MRRWLCTLVPLALLACGASAAPAQAAPDPEKRVEREARKHNRTLGRELSHLGAGNPFLVDLQEALATTAAVLGQDYELVLVTDSRVETDWVATAELGSTEGGDETWSGRRWRVIATVSGGQEVTVELSCAMQTRTLVAGQSPTSWTSGSCDPDTERAEVFRRLRAIELSRTETLKFDLPKEEVAQYVAASLPAGYAAVQGSVPLQAVSWSRFEDSNKRKQITATWERRRMLTVFQLGSSPTSVRAQIAEEDCFFVDGEEPQCAPAPVVDPRPVWALQAALYRSAFEHLKLPPPSLPAPAHLERPIREPPEPPRLRTAAEISSVALEAAREEGTKKGQGWFRITLVSVTVPELAPNGRPWDDLSLLSSLVGLAAASAGAGAVADLADDVAEEATAPVTHPDLVGTVKLSGQLVANLPYLENATGGAWNLTLDLPFDLARSDWAPGVQVHLIDQDPFGESDVIADGLLLLRDILDRGQDGIQVGHATFVAGAEWLRPL